MGTALLEAGLTDRYAALVAEACLINLWSRVAEYHPDGDLTGVSDSALALWAQWPGDPTPFARAFRQQFMDGDKVHDWYDHNGRALDRLEKDRSRKRDNITRNLAETAENHTHSVEFPRTFRNAAGVNEYEYDKQTVVGKEARAAHAARVAAREPNAVCLQLTIALNEGLQANPRVEAFMPVPPHVSFQTVEEWVRDGIDLEVADKTIRDVAGRFRPTQRNRTINTLRYCDAAVRTAHENATLAALAGRQSDERAGGATGSSLKRVRLSTGQPGALNGEGA